MSQVGLMRDHVNIQSREHFATFWTLLSVVFVVDPLVGQHRIDVFELLATLDERALKVPLLRMGEQVLVQAILLAESFVAIRTLEFTVGTVSVAQV
jgi:hypothetical protein